MAYNREWDRGKDSWAHSNQWSTQDSRATVRGREEDYTGDGKRRKFNNGVRGVFPTFYVSLHPITQGL
jgi:RNA-binding protein 5/10